MELDNEIKGEGNNYDFGARMYDPRVMRWLSTDNMEGKYPGYSPYNYAINNPILFIDINGEDLIIAGSAKQWAKFKARVEAEFGGSIELRRDASNKVTMHITDVPLVPRENFINPLESYDVVANAYQEKIIGSELYQVLNRAITHERDTKLDLVETIGDRQNVLVGQFRGQNWGDPQQIDMSDLDDLDKFSGDLKLGTGGLIHEVEEAYQDKAVMNQPAVSSMKALFHAFKGPHQKALEAQKRYDGMNEVYNFSTENSSGQVTKLAIVYSVIDGKGNTTYNALELTISKNNITGSTTKTNVKLLKDAKSNVVNYK